MKKLSIKYNEKVISFNSNPWGLCFRWRYINAEKRCPVNIYLLKINNGNIRKKCEICSKLTIKTPPF